MEIVLTLHSTSYCHRGCHNVWVEGSWNGYTNQEVHRS